MIESRKQPWSWKGWLLGFLAFTVVFLVVYRATCPPGHICRCNYLRIQAGMSVDEVEGLLGPGQEVERAAMPTRPGGALIIEGDRFYGWYQGSISIHVSFKANRVHEKDWWEPSL